MNNPYPYNEKELGCDDNIAHDAYEEGYIDAAAVVNAEWVEWLYEPCKEHPELDAVRVDSRKLWFDWKGKIKVFYYTHRKDCPQCMAELRGEK